MSVLLCENLSKKMTTNPITNFNYNFLDKKIYGILGKTNSGISTLLELLSGKTNPSKGNIWIDGENLKQNNEMQERICYIKKNSRYSDLTTVRLLFNKMKMKYPKWDNFYAYTLIKHFKIELNSLVNALSLSKRELLLGICSIASRANIVIYDDPVANADIKDRDDFYKFLYDHHSRYPNTIIIATNFIDEFSYVFDKVLFLDEGRLFRFYTIQELKENFRYLSGKTEVLYTLIKGVKIIGAEEQNGILTVCISKKLNKDETRKFQKYMINISEVPIQKVFVYLINLREMKSKKYDLI